jgi:hypothetical protein
MDLLAEISAGVGILGLGWTIGLHLIQGRAELKKSRRLKEAHQKLQLILRSAQKPQTRSALQFMANEVEILKKEYPDSREVADAAANLSKELRKPLTAYPSRPTERFLGDQMIVQFRLNCVSFSNPHLCPAGLVLGITSKQCRKMLRYKPRMMMKTSRPHGLARTWGLASGSKIISVNGPTPSARPPGPV